MKIFFIKIVSLFQRQLKKIKNKIIKGDGYLIELRHEINDLANCIEKNIVDVNDNFLYLGQEFQKVFDGTENLKSLVVKTSQLSDTNESGPNILNVSSISEKTVEKLKNSRNEISGNLHKLLECCNYLKNLSGMCEQTDKVSTLLNVIALNIAIESNRYEKSREMFKVFVEEVKDLSNKIKNISEDLFNDSELARLKQLKYHSEISKDLDQLNHLSHKAEKVVRKSVNSIEQLMERSITAINYSGKCSDEIYSMASSIVMAMQFHDIIRQQIEHVVLAFRDAETFLSEESENFSEIDKDVIFSKLHSIFIIQNGQINSVISEVEKAYYQILKSFEGIDEKIKELISSLSVILNETGNENNDNDIFAHVLLNLNQLNEFLSEASNLNLRMSDASGDASESTEGLLKHVDLVESISLDLQRKALNAIIKAAHLDEKGRALEVFAQEVTSTSNESNKFANIVIKMINKITDIATQMSLNTQKSCINKMGELSLSDEIEEIKNSYDLFIQNSNEVFAKSKNFEKIISGAKESTLFMSDFAGRLKEHLNKSELILKKIESYDWNAKDKTTLGVNDRYTMESEREIHTQLLKDSDKAPETQDKKKEDIENEINDLEVNLNENNITEREVINDELKDDEEKNEKEDEFGENIELF